MQSHGSLLHPAPVLSSSLDTPFPASTHPPFSLSLCSPAPTLIALRGSNNGVYHTSRPGQPTILSLTPPPPQPQAVPKQYRQQGHFLQAMGVRGPLKRNEPVSPCHMEPIYSRAVRSYHSLLALFHLCTRYCSPTPISPQLSLPNPLTQPMLTGFWFICLLSKSSFCPSW